MTGAVFFLRDDGRTLATTTEGPLPGETHVQAQDNHSRA